MSPEENKSVIRRYFEEVHNQRKVDVLDEIFSPDLAQATRAIITMMVIAFPDYRISITHQVAEGDTVATVWTISGTHLGEWMSPMGTIPPSGQRVTYTGTTTLRITDGKIVDVIGSNHDHLGILQQMGVVPTIVPRSGRLVLRRKLQTS